MDQPIGSQINRPALAFIDPTLADRHVKLVQPSNAAIIAGLAVTCWLPVALSAYLLAG